MPAFPFYFGSKENNTVSRPLIHVSVRCAPQKDATNHGGGIYIPPKEGWRTRGREISSRGDKMLIYFRGKVPLPATHPPTIIGLLVVHRLKMPGVDYGLR